MSTTLTNGGNAINGTREAPSSDLNILATSTDHSFPHDASNGNVQTGFVSRDAETTDDLASSVENHTKESQFNGVLNQCALKSHADDKALSNGEGENSEHSVGNDDDTCDILFTQPNQQPPPNETTEQVGVNIEMDATMNLPHSPNGGIAASFTKRELLNRKARENGRNHDTAAKTIRSTDKVAVKSLVQEVHAQVVKVRLERSTQTLQDALAKYRDGPREKRGTTASKTQTFPRLPSSLTVTIVEGPNGNVAQRPSARRKSLKLYRDASNNKVRATVECAPLESGMFHEVLPPSTAVVFMKGCFYAEDQEDLEFVPYFGDDERGAKVSDIYDREARGLFNLDTLQKQRTIGPEYQELATNEEIDESLQLLYQRVHERVVDDIPLPLSRDRIPLQDTLHRMLADVMRQKVDRIHDRYVKCMVEQDADESETVQPKRKTPVPYADMVDTYHSLLCRRCFSYDCNLHCAPNPSPDIKHQGDLAAMKELSGYWNDSNKEIAQSHAMSPVTIRKRSYVELELSDFQKSVCERLMLAFQGDTEKISNALDCSKEVVEKYIESENLTVPLQCLPVKVPPEFSKRRKMVKYYSMGNYNGRWLKNVLQAQLEQPYFMPCNHEEICSDKNCTCVENGSFCTKHCLWGSLSRNFFRGCACNGRCVNNTCSCVAANRECDPDLCVACGTCTDPPEQPVTNQRCLNDNIGMRRHAHLLRAKSGIEGGGWGAFTRNALKKGQYVHEYVGELISQDEAERRGHTYDLQKRSFLFNLNSDYALDASRKGNVSRFINHSNKPNVIAKVRIVNGDYRVGFYAKEDVEAQSEIFFDYQYDPTKTRGFHENLQGVREAKKKAK